MDNGIGIGAGYFTTTGDAQCTTPTNCTLSDGGAFGSLIALGDGDNYDFGSKTLNARRTQAGIVPGISADIWQVDVMWSGNTLGKNITIHGTYGQAKDDFSWASGSYATQSTVFSAVDAEQEFWRIFGRVDVSDEVYLAARYGVSTNETAGIGDDDNELSRIQVGGGWWVRDNVLIKAEYVKQEEAASPAAAAVNLVRAIVNGMASI